MKVLVVVGPTGVGKSDLGIALAQKYNGEIISGDSIQIYKQLDIGSAKVSKAEQKLVVHHLVDEYPLSDPFDVTMFQSQARALIRDITQRKKLPIIVGGTGLYISAVLKNYIFQEEVFDEALVARLHATSNEDLFTELFEKDPIATKKIHVNNRPRLIRALLIALTTNTLRSELEAKQDNRLLYDTFLVSLTMERQALYARINERVLQMIDDGLEAEVRTILKDYPDAFKLRGMSGIGYKEWEPYFKTDSDYSLDQVIDRIQKHSRNYAKRQFTWFNNQFETYVVDIEKEHYQEKLEADISAWLEHEGMHV
ncbi:MAG: tRNA (adenosine(37)-N6)-dimethylallyltransferase MiaA [Erysipelothrix sp.]|nr:tRNA (adenosine(37)-N6)-dimethylallyltransferase MiaA [Erysipelothrix sp.]